MNRATATVPVSGSVSSGNDSAVCTTIRPVTLSRRGRNCCTRGGLSIRYAFIAGILRLVGAFSVRLGLVADRVAAVCSGVAGEGLLDHLAKRRILLPQHDRHPPERGQAQ